MMIIRVGNIYVCISLAIEIGGSPGNNLSGFASQFATQNIHSRDANLAPSAKNRDTFLRTRMCPGGSTGGCQLDYYGTPNATKFRLFLTRLIG